MLPKFQKKMKIMLRVNNLNRMSRIYLRIITTSSSRQIILGFKEHSMFTLYSKSPCQKLRHSHLSWRVFWRSSSRLSRQRWSSANDKSYITKSSSLRRRGSVAKPSNREWARKDWREKLKLRIRITKLRSLRKKNLRQNRKLREKLRTILRNNNQKRITK